MPSLSVSIVLFNNTVEEIVCLVRCFKSVSLPLKVILIDNSKTQLDLTNLNIDKRFSYLPNPNGNNGFGAGHNTALKNLTGFEYHLILNLDVSFSEDSLISMIDYLENNEDIGLISPKILSYDNNIQYLCKTYPTVSHLLIRRFLPASFQKFFKNYTDKYTMYDSGYDRIMNVQYLSGCFMLFRRKYLDEIGHFDENFFLYFEDADITFRMAKKHKTIFYPSAYIYHGWTRGSHKSFRLMWVTIKSAYYFFSKHGWKFL